MQTEPSSRVRVDKWLWAARFFKTRALATDAVNGGHVHVNGERSKPAHPIKPGDVLKITKAATTFEITVTALAQRRGTATAAQALYREDPASLARRQQQSMSHKLNAMSNPRPSKRPDKRQRRQLKAWQEQQ
jgi:ribosome-associated heat shock protein Hsp15